MENQVKDKQYIIEELLRKSIQNSCSDTVAISNLIDSQKFMRYTENLMTPSSNVTDSVNCVKVGLSRLRKFLPN